MVFRKSTMMILASTPGHGESGTLDVDACARQHQEGDSSNDQTGRMMAAKNQGHWFGGIS
jgi:hypothetical protein